MSGDITGEGRSQEARDRRRTFKDVNDPEVVESNGDPVVVDSTDGPVLVEPDHAAPVEPLPPVDDQGPAHRAQTSFDGSDGPTPEPVVTEHPVTPAPVPVSAALGDTSPSPTVAPSADSTPTEVAPAPAVSRPTDSTPTEVAPAPAPTAPAPTTSAPTAPVAPAASAPLAPVPPASSTEQRTIYVDAPTPPKKKSNRGIGALIALASTVVFALVWAGVSALIIAIVTPGERFSDYFLDFVASAAFYAPIIAYLIAMLLLVLVLNRAGWAWYIIGGFVAAAIVYAGYLAGALVTVAQDITPGEVQQFLARNSISPLAIAAGIAAREVSIWTGAAISARGKRVKARNVQAREAFDRESAERKAEYDRARTGYTGA